MVYLRKRKKFSNHLHCVSSGKNSMFSVDSFVVIIPAFACRNLVKEMGTKVKHFEYFERRDEEET